MSIDLLPKSKKKHAVRPLKYDAVEAEVLETLKLYREKNVPVTGVLLRDEAMFIANQLGIVDFTASTGWLRSFKVRNDVFFRKLHGKIKCLLEHQLFSICVCMFKCFVGSRLFI